MNKKKALITGGCGFIGSHLAQGLIMAGHDVVVLDDFSSGRRENLNGLQVEIVEGSICDFQTLYDAAKDCEMIFHQAALVSVPLSVEDPVRNHQINVDGTFNVFEVARLRGIQRVVYASSAAVYGDNPSLPCKLDAPLQPISPYAAAKMMSEVFAQTYNRTYGTEFIGLRYFNVYGPRQDPSSPYSGFLSICCNRILSGKEVTIFGDGMQTRDFVYVSDVVQANLAASQMEFNKENSVFNVASGSSITLNYVMDTFAKIVDQNVAVQHGPARAGDIRYSEADIINSVEILGFNPEFAFKDGLKGTFDWYKSRIRD